MYLSTYLDFHIVYDISGIFVVIISIIIIIIVIIIIRPDGKKKAYVRLT